MSSQSFNSHVNPPPTKQPHNPSGTHTNIPILVHMN